MSWNTSDCGDLVWHGTARWWCESSIRRALLSASSYHASQIDPFHRHLILPSQRHHLIPFPISLLPQFLLRFIHYHISYFYQDFSPFFHVFSLFPAIRFPLYHHFPLFSSPSDYLSPPSYSFYQNSSQRENKSGKTIDTKVDRRQTENKRQGYWKRHISAISCFAVVWSSLCPLRVVFSPYCWRFYGTITVFSL